jgi:chromatin segregation and condensation protein Rec8/ScpA/Scc1 (kleisin family)
VGGVSEAFQPDLDFEATREAVGAGEAFIVDLDAYEGPLDVLLALARAQKVDLMQVSIAQLADQFLAFVREARRRRFSLAADYLVMAAWLAWLKSRLLLPRPERGAADELPADEAAQQLAFRLARLDAMRKAAEALLGGPVLRRDVFGRGDPEEAKIVSSSRIAGDLYELMEAYVSQRKRDVRRRYTTARHAAGLAALDPAHGRRATGRRGRRTQPRLVRRLDAVGDAGVRSGRGSGSAAAGALLGDLSATAQSPPPPCGAGLGVGV